MFAGQHEENVFRSHQYGLLYLLYCKPTALIYGLCTLLSAYLIMFSGLIEKVKKGRTGAI